MGWVSAGFVRVAWLDAMPMAMAMAMVATGDGLVVYLSEGRLRGRTSAEIAHAAAHMILGTDLECGYCTRLTEMIELEVSDVLRSSVLA